MEGLLDKLSSYNLFNYLLPGILFAVIGDWLTSYELVQEDLLVAPFVYYFIGSVVSRIGSLVVEPRSLSTTLRQWAVAFSEDPRWIGEPRGRWAAATDLRLAIQPVRRPAPVCHVSAASAD